MDSSLYAFKFSLKGLSWIPGVSYLRSRAFLTPRLGKLFLYSPREVVLPDHYNQAVGRGRDNLSITLVTPSYCSDRYLEKTITSVFDQHYPALQYVIQDGNSTDQSVSIIRRFAGQLYRWESRADKGQAHAINLGFSETDGEIMAWLNADDILLPGALAYVAKFFRDHPEVEVVYGHRVLIDAEDKEIGRWILPPHCRYTITWHDFIPQETLFWRRSLWERTGGRINESLQFAMDWELILRFREAGASFVRLPRFLGAFRVHPDMKSIKDIDTIGVREMDMLRKKYRDPDIDDDRLEKYIRSYLRTHLFLDRLYKCRILNY